MKETEISFPSQYMLNNWTIALKRAVCMQFSFVPFALYNRYEMYCRIVLITMVI